MFEIPHNEHNKCIHWVHTFHAQDGILTSVVVVIVVVICCCCSPSPPHLVTAAACCHPTCDPPHKQLLMRLGVGCVISCSSLLPSLLLSSLQAEAHNSGGAVLSTVLSCCYSSIGT